MPLPSIAAPGTYDLTIYQGSAFNLSFEFVDGNSDPLVLTGLTAESKIVRSFPDGDIAGEFTCTVGAGGAVQVAMTSTDAESLWLGRRVEDRIGKLGHYDLELIDGNDRVRVMQGQVFLSQEATR